MKVMKAFPYSVFFLIGCLACQANPVKLKLKPVGEFKLEERGDSILANINSVRISPSGTMFLISDSKSKAIFLYSRDGQLLNAFYPDSDLSDSLVAGKKPLLPSDSLIAAWSLSKTFDVPLSKLLSNLQSDYLDACFINDSEIIIGAVVRAWLYHSTDSRDLLPKWTALQGALVRIGLDGKVYNFHAIEVGPRQSFAWLSSMDYIQGDSMIVCNVGNPLSAQAGHWDSTAGLAEIDLRGNYVRSLCSIPMQFSASRLGYSFLSYRLTSSGNKSMFAVTMIPSVYSSSGDKLFDLQGITERNENFFRLGSQKASNKSITWDSVLRASDFGFSQIIAEPDNEIIAIFTIRSKD
jgi:hypothetical protein